MSPVLAFARKHGASYYQFSCLIAPHLGELIGQAPLAHLEVLKAQLQSGRAGLYTIVLIFWVDKHRVGVDRMFVDLENEDFRVKPDSPALELGFKNFDMNWGITDEFPEMWRE